MDTFSPVLMLLIGLVLLFSGRRIFWLAAALAAFLFTYQLLQNFLEPGWTGIVIAAVIGLIFSGLAISFIKTAGFIVGALAGAAALPYLLGLFGIDLSWWILALVGAVLGIIAVSLAFDWGLLVMTAWLGANVAAGAAGELFSLSGAISSGLFLILMVLGIMVQAGLLKKKQVGKSGLATITHLCY